jgi:hypothetical protein
MVELLSFSYFYLFVVNLDILRVSMVMSFFQVLDNAIENLSQIPFQHAIMCLTKELFGKIAWTFLRYILLF